MVARFARARAALLALAAALAAAGCTVNVEGAPCSVPGSTTPDCPDGQACGLDRKCSLRASTCAPAPGGALSTSPDVTGMCHPDASVCSTTASPGKNVEVRCDGSDPVCGAWVVVDCAAQGMECGTRGSTACECPEYAGTTVFASPPPVGSPSRDLAPFPRGQASPPQCRFGSLSDALLAVSTAPVAIVQIAADPGDPAVFGTTTGERFPIVVAAGTTLRAAGAPAGPSIVRGPDPSYAGTIVRVLGAIEGVRVEGNGARGVGIELACGPAGTPTLRGVAVHGGGTLDPTGAGSLGAAVVRGLKAGISASGACGASVQRAAVTAVAGPALLVDAGAGPVQVAGGSFGGSEMGLWLRGGTVTVAPDAESVVTVSGNAGEGIAVGASLDAVPPSLAVLDATLDRVVVTGNGGVGVAATSLAEPGAVLRVRGCELSGNGFTRPRTSGVGTPANYRAVGGLLLSLASSATVAELGGTRFWANAGDQVAIESGDAWTIGPAACGAGTNVFACIPTGQWAIWLFQLGGTGQVNAPFNRWPGAGRNGYIGYIDGDKVKVTPSQAVCDGSMPFEPEMIPSSACP